MQTNLSYYFKYKFLKIVIVLIQYGIQFKKSPSSQGSVQEKSFISLVHMGGSIVPAYPNGKQA